MNYNGNIPIPAKLLLWILSNDCAITALIPKRYGPLAAQSLDDPDPYSAPAKIIVWCPYFWYLKAASLISKIYPVGTYLVCGPTLSTSLFIILVLANVPLAIT